MGPVMHGGAMLVQTLVGAGSAARCSELGPVLSYVCMPKFMRQEHTTHAHYVFSNYQNLIATFSLPSLGRRSSFFLLHVCQVSRVRLRLFGDE